MGTSQPRRTRTSAILITLSRSRMELGPKRQMSRARMVGWVQLFCSQSSNLPAAKGGGSGVGSCGGRPWANRSNSVAIVVIF
jgi:hypothetical protein